VHRDRGFTWPRKSSFSHRHAKRRPDATSDFLQRSCFSPSIRVVEDHLRALLHQAPRSDRWTGLDNHATREPLLSCPSLWLDTPQTIQINCHPKQIARHLRRDTIPATISLSPSILQHLHRDLVASDGGVRCCSSAPRLIRCLQSTPSVHPSFPGPMQLCCAPNNMPLPPTGQARQLLFSTTTTTPKPSIFGPLR
jgi:hypothetical protein